MQLIWRNFNHKIINCKHKKNEEEEEQKSKKVESPMREKNTFFFFFRLILSPLQLRNIHTLLKYTLLI